MGTAKNINFSHFNEVIFTGFDFLQGIQIYSWNYHMSLETLIAKNISVFHVAWKRLIGIMS